MERVPPAVGAVPPSLSPHGQQLLPPAAGEVTSWSLRRFPGGRTFGPRQEAGEKHGFLPGPRPLSREVSLAPPSSDPVSPGYRPCWPRPGPEGSQAGQGSDSSSPVQGEVLASDTSGGPCVVDRVGTLSCGDVVGHAPQCERQAGHVQGSRTPPSLHLRPSPVVPSPSRDVCLQRWLWPSLGSLHTGPLRGPVTDR